MQTEGRERQWRNNRIIETMDKLMGAYYAEKQRNSYFDENGIGKLKKFYTDNKYNAMTSRYTVIAVDLSFMTSLIGFDDEFPLNLNDKDEKKKQIHKILKYFYKISSSEKLKLNDLPTKNQSLSWNHILEIVHLEFDEKYKESLQEIIGQNVLKQT